MPQPDRNAYTRVMDEVVRQSQIYLEHRSQAPVAPAAIANPGISLPKSGVAPEQALAHWLEWAGDGIASTSGPNYFGFVTGGVQPAALAGDWFASVIDQNAATSVTSAAAAATEALVIRWMLDLLHFPAEWGGVMTSGATMSNFLALAAARQAIGTALGFDPTEDGLAGNPPIRVVTSSEVHSSVVKSLGALGLGRAVTTMLPAPEGSVEISALRAWLGEHAEPCIIIANASEVNTGQFDNLSSIVQLRDELSPQSWIHVDGAFGAFAGASPAKRHLLRGIEHADSVTTDGHKWLNVPYDAGFVFYRDVQAGRAAFTMHTAYQTRDGGFDADTMSLEFSRRFRALPAWCALYAAGRDGYREIVERSIINANTLRSLIVQIDGVELVNRDAQLRTPFCIVAFRYTHADWSDEQTEEANRQAATRINALGNSYVSGTKWQGQSALRAAFVNWQTRDEHVRQLFADILAVRDQLLT